MAVTAAGTVAYHAGLLADLRRTAVTVVWAALAAAAIGAVVVTAPRAPDGLRRTVTTAPRRSTIAAIALAAAAAIVRYAWPASARWWWAFWALLIAALAVGVHAALTGGAATREDEPTAAAADRGAAIVLLLALALAIASLITMRPDLDDVYVVNRSVYIENHAGQLPTDDVVFSDQQLSGQRAPMRSPAFEALIGITAAVLPVPAATVAYFVVAPLVSMLSLLAVWRLARKLACRAPLVATAAAAAFLLLDGSTHAGFGNLSFGRAWQGKVVLTAVAVPLIWTYAVGWARDGSRRDLVLLAATNVAAAGLSSTGLFVAPIATAVVTIATIAADRGNAHRLIAAASATAYPAGIAIFNRTADTGLDNTTGTSIGVSPWARWAFVVGRPAIAITTAGLALAWIATRDRTARAVLTIAPMLVALTLYGPRLADPLRLLAPGAASILWRAVWVLPVPALVGIAASAPHAGTIAAAALFAATTTPVMTATNGASVGWPRWDTGGNLAVAQRLVDEAPPRSLVAGPFEVDRVVPLITSDVRAVDPRPGWYADGIDPAPRQLVQHALAEGIDDGDEAAAFAGAIERLDVDAVALPWPVHTPGQRTVHRVLTDHGFVARGIEGQYLILRDT